MISNDVNKMCLKLFLESTKSSGSIAYIKKTTSIFANGFFKIRGGSTMVVQVSPKLPTQVRFLSAPS